MNFFVIVHKLFFLSLKDLTFVLIKCLCDVQFVDSFRSLSELEGVRLEGQTSEKIRQVTERATLFRITSNAMINVRQPGSIFALGNFLCGCPFHT